MPHTDVSSFEKLVTTFHYPVLRYYVAVARNE